MSGPQPVVHLRNTLLAPVFVLTGLGTRRMIQPSATTALPSTALAELRSVIVAGALVLPPTAAPKLVPAWKATTLREKRRTTSVAALRQAAPGSPDARQRLAELRGPLAGADGGEAQNGHAREGACRATGARSRAHGKEADPAQAERRVLAFLRAHPMGATLWHIHRSLSGFDSAWLRRTLAALRRRGRARMEHGARKSRNGPIPEVWFAVG
jgi:hypothetical protein